MTEKCLKSLFDEEAPERGCRTPSVFDLTSFREWGISGSSVSENPIHRKLVHAAPVR